MNENIKVLLEKLSKDEATVAKLQAIKDPDEAYALVSSIQGGISKEEFIDTMKKIQAAAEGELSDEEVAAAAGGSSSDVVSWLISKGEDLALSSAASTV